MFNYYSQLTNSLNLNKILLLSFATSFLLISHNANAVQFYTTTEEINSTTSAYYSSLVQTANGDYHVVWQEGSHTGNVYYSTNSGSGWSAKQDLGNNLQIGGKALVADGNDLHLAARHYVAFNDWGIKHLEKPSGSSWTAGNFVVSNVRSVTAPSIDLKLDGNPAIAYEHNYNTPNRVNYASYNGASWNVENALDLNIAWQNLAHTSTGDPVVVFYDNVVDRAAYVKKTGGAWSSETFLTTQYPDYFSGTVDPNNDTALAYYLYADVNDGPFVAGKEYLAYNVNGTGEIVYEITGSTPYPYQVGQPFYDASDNVYIPYMDTNADDLRLAYKMNGTWTDILVSTDGAGGDFPSGMINAAGDIVISFESSTLEFATLSQGNIDDDTNNGVNFLADMGGGILVTFDDVDSDGRLTKTAGNTANFAGLGEVMGSSLFALTPEDFTFTGNYTIAIPYSEGELGNFPEHLNKIYKYFNGELIDITTSVDTVNNIVYGQASSFSEFAVVANPEPTTLILLTSGLLGLLPAKKKFFRH